MVEYLRVFSHVVFLLLLETRNGTNAMDVPNWTAARRIAQSASQRVRPARSSSGEQAPTPNQ